MRKYLLFIALAASMLLFDQVVKYWTVANLTIAPAGQTNCDGGFQRFLSCAHPRMVRRTKIVGDAIQLIYVENPGAAWGMFRDSEYRVPFLLSIAVLAMIFITYYYKRTPLDHHVLRVGLGLVLGGALGNFIDRARLGYVIDMIRVDFGFWPINPWPTWNIADAALAIGVGLILIDGFFLHRKPPAPPPKKKKR